MKNNLMAPLFTLLRANAGKDNLITSAIMEMLEFIRSVKPECQSIIVTNTYDGAILVARWYSSRV